MWNQILSYFLTLTGSKCSLVALVQKNVGESWTTCADCSLTWHEEMMGMKVAMLRSSRPEVFCKKVFLEISQNLQKIFKNTFFKIHLWAIYSDTARKEENVHHSSIINMTRIQVKWQLISGDELRMQITPAWCGWVGMYVYL